MSMGYIRKTYGVPAKRGGRVIYTGSHTAVGRLIRPDNATVHRAGKEKLTMSNNAASPASMQPIVPRPVLYWVLVGHWEGTPFPIMRGEDPPPFSVWSVTDRDQWERLRKEKYYTRRSKSRPVAKVDREFQRQTGKDVWEE